MSNLPPVQNEYNRTFKSLNELRNELESDNKASQNRRDQQVKDLEEAYRRSLLRKDEVTESAVQKIKEDSHQKLDQYKQSYLDDLSAMKENTYNKNGILGQTIERQDQLNEQHKKQVDLLLEAQGKQKKVDQEKIDSLAQRHRENETKILDHFEAETRKTRDANSEQYAGLKEVIAPYNREAERRAKEEFDRSVIEKEHDLDREHYRIQKTYQEDLNHLNENAKEKEGALNEKFKSALDEKGVYYTHLLQDQNLDHKKGVVDLQDSINSQLEHWDRQRDQEQKHFEQQTSHYHDQAQRQQEDALRNQATTYQDTLARNNQESSQKIKTLQDSNQHLKTTSNVGDISPLAEENIRQGVIQNYEKTRLKEREQTQQSIGDIYDLKSDEIRAIIDQNEMNTTKDNQRIALERSIERTEFLDKVNETESITDQKMRTQESSHTRERDGMIRKFSQLMDRQRQEADYVLETMKNNFESKLGNLRVESDAHLKSTIRALNVRQNELIREYEKKLVDQKADSDNRYEDLKSQSQKQIHEQEQRAKKETETLTKSHEQKISQLEAQFNERERYLAQTYQDELDRTRRSYELLSKKKS